MMRRDCLIRHLVTLLLPPVAECVVLSCMGIELAQWWPVGRWGVALVLASYMSSSGLKKKSLNRSGAMAVRVYLVDVSKRCTRWAAKATAVRCTYPRGNTYVACRLWLPHSYFG